MILSILLLIASLAVLVKGADYFTEGAESIGVKLNIPQFVIGVTIVSIGTSLPELASSIAAVIAGSSEIVIANIVGSNIANILFILGLGAIIGNGMRTGRNVLKKDFPILLATSILLILTCINGVFGIFEALLFLVLTAWYLHHTFKEKTNEKIEQHYHGLRAVAALIGGLFLVVVSAKFLIDAVISLATIAGISPTVISATVVAFGTSVPEAVVTITALLKNKRDIALGNIIGSNIFNILLIPGLAGLISPLAVETNILYLALPIMFCSTLLLGYALYDKVISRKEGIVMLAIYILFVAFIFI